MSEEKQQNDPPAPPGRGPGSGPEPGQKRPPGEPPGKGKSQAFLFVAILLAVLLAVVALSTDGVPSSGVETNRYRARELLLQGKLDPDSMVYVDDTRTFRAKLKDPIPGPEGEEISMVVVRFATDDEVDRFQEAIEEYNTENDANIDWKIKESRTPFWQFLLASLPWILFILIIYLVFFRQFRMSGAGGNVLGFAKSRAKLARRDDHRVTFADVAGIAEAKEDVQEIIEFLKDPKKFQRLGGRIPRGIMLVGSPGTGKTLLAKAIAGEADVPFFSISGSDFVEMFVGVGAARVRDLFKQAKENSPCIVFLDEVDAVGRRRGSGLGGGHDEREQTLNAILVEMDGFDSDEGIIVVAATNRPDVLDPALLRPGRFDREIVIDLPDLDGREAILKVHTRKVKLDKSVDLRRVARGTPSFSGAELAALVNEAAIIAVMKGQDTILEPDFEEARDKIRWGRQKTSRITSEEDKRITAYHEAGHAVVTHLLPDAEPLHKVTIVPRGMALGATMHLPERDRIHYARKTLLAQVKVLYAGRISEHLFCHDITAGAANDIERATEVVRRMVCQWGMSEQVGPINYSEGQETLFLGREITRTRTHSEALSLKIDEEVRRIVDECYKATEDLILQHRDAVIRVAEALVIRETLSAREVVELMEGERGNGGSEQGEVAEGES